MIYECEQCGSALPAGVSGCPKCGKVFDEAVPHDAEVPKRGWQSKPELSVPPVETAKPNIPTLDTLTSIERYPDYIVPGETSFRLPSIKILVGVGLFLVILIFFITRPKDISAPIQSTTEQAVAATEEGSVIEAAKRGLCTSPDTQQVNDTCMTQIDNDMIPQVEELQSDDAEVMFISKTRRNEVGQPIEVTGKLKRINGQWQLYQRW